MLVACCKSHDFGIQDRNSHTQSLSKVGELKMYNQFWKAWNKWNACQSTNLSAFRLSYFFTYIRILVEWNVTVKDELNDSLTHRGFINLKSSHEVLHRGYSPILQGKQRTVTKYITINAKLCWSASWLNLKWFSPFGKILWLHGTHSQERQFYT